MAADCIRINYVTGHRALGTRNFLWPKKSSILQYVTTRDLEYLNSPETRNNQFFFHQAFGFTCCVQSEFDSEI